MGKRSANSCEKKFLEQHPNLKRIDPKFFYQNTIQVAQAVLGKILFVSDSTAGVAIRIVETEAYSGDDPASHSARGITPRCAPMFEAGGIVYVYFIYGMYEMLNFVTEKKSNPGAVLIRGAEVFYGEREVERRRKGIPKKNHLNGPGRLARSLGIRLADNRKSLFGPRFFLFEDDFSLKQVKKSTRIGIREAKERKWRFYIEGSVGVSPYLK